MSEIYAGTELKVDPQPWGKVLSVTPCGARTVYDLSVRDEHSFCVGGSIVHNCFQEQTMAVVRALAGYSLAQADHVRKIMGKKKPELLEKERARFEAGVRAAGVCDQATAARVWAVIEASSAYSFNKSHSVAYGYLAYYTAYLKRHHPAEFYAAWMTSLTTEAESHKRLAEGAYDARAHGVEVLPPCARRSAADFVVEPLPGGGTAVRYGLRGLRGLGQKCVASLLAERARAPLGGMADFLRRVRATKRDLAALVGSGACDELLAADGADRARALVDLAALVRWAKSEAAVTKAATKAPARARSAKRRQAEDPSQLKLLTPGGEPW